MNNERRITRKVVKSRVYDIYSFTGGQAVKLDSIEVEGRIKEKELCKKYNVPNIATELVKENIVTYSMPVSEFMKYATLDMKEGADNE